MHFSSTSIGQHGNQKEELWLLELFFTLHQHAFCAFVHVGQTVRESLFLLEWWDSVTHPRSTDDIQKPCWYPELRYQTRGKSADVEWDAPINESQMPGMRIMIGKGIKELGWSIHEMITVCHSLWCHTTLNNFCGFYEVLMHHSTTVMWNGDSEKVALKGKSSDTILLWGFCCCFSRKPNTNYFNIKILHFCACCSGWAGAVLVFLVISVWTGCSLDHLLYGI